MVQTPQRLVDLVEWIINVIPPEGHTWQITLNSDGRDVDAIAQVVQSRQDNASGHKTIISQVTKAKFRISASTDKRTVFTTE